MQQVQAERDLLWLPAHPTDCNALHCGAVCQPQSMVLYSTLPLLSSIPPAPLNQYLHLVLVLSVVIFSCKWFCE